MKNKLKKEQTFWVVREPKGVYISDACRTKYDALRNFGVYAHDRHWPRLRKDGYRCVKVRLKEAGK